MGRGGLREFAVEAALDVLPPGAAALEVGCGDGVYTQQLAAGGLRMQCADLDCWHHDLPGISHTRGADLSRRLPFADNQFDGVISMEVIEHVTNPFNAVAEYARILRQDGRLILTLPNFWGARARWRFFWRGSLNRIRTNDRAMQEQFRNGNSPHINVMPWPTFKFALASHGFDVEVMRGHKSSSRGWKQLQWLPLALVIRLTRFLPRGYRQRLELDETNQWSVLYGSAGIYIQARKTTSYAAKTTAPEGADKPEAAEPTATVSETI